MSSMALKLLAWITWVEVGVAGPRSPSSVMLWMFSTPLPLMRRISSMFSRFKLWLMESEIVLLPLTLMYSIVSVPLPPLML